jgi:HK97 family phage major capsid protein
MMNPTLLAKALPLARYAQALGASKGNARVAASFAAARWGESDRTALALKAAADYGTTLNDSDATWGSELADMSALGRQFVEAVAEASVLGRLQLAGMRRVLFDVWVLMNPAATRSAAFVPEGHAAPVGRMTVGNVLLAPQKVIALSVVSGELARMADPSSTALIAADLVSGVSEAVDAQMLDTALAGNGPDPLTLGAPSVASQADPCRDVAALIELFQGDFTSAVFTMHPSTAARIGAWRASTVADVPDVFQTLNLRTGGTILGVPVALSRKAPIDEIAVIDAAGVVFAQGDVVVDTSEEGTIQMDTAPDEPTGSNTVSVSLFQRNLIALQSRMYINWRRVRTGAVARVTNVDYHALS